MSRTPRALTIAGSDSGGGAGLQADLKTFAAHGVYGASVVTAVTAQNTLEVRDVQLISAELVTSQLEAVVSDIGIDAVKIGMLGDAAISRAVARGLARLNVPVVLDPVMVAKSGDVLLDDAALEVLLDELLPRSTLVTPNLPELAKLTGVEVDSEEGRTAAASHLCARGPSVLVKGGHAQGTRVEDELWHRGERRVFDHPRIETRHTHGTGCTLSSAIAARMARGEPLVAAVGGAIDFVHRAIRSAPGIGRGHGPVDHLHGLRGADET